MGGFVRSSCARSVSSGLHTSSLDTKSVAGLGDTLYLPVLPLFDSNPAAPAFVSPPKIIKVDGSGAVSDFYVFPASESEAFDSHFFAQTTIDGVTGNVSRGDAVSVVVDAAGNVYYSNSLGDTVYRFDPSGNRTELARGLPQILSLAIGPDGAVYGATGAFYNGPVLNKAPQIVKLDTSGNATTIATLPNTYDYATGFFGTQGQPIGLMIDLAFDAASNIYVTVNMAGVVLKIPHGGDAGTGSAPAEVAAGLVAPSGVVASADGHLLVAEGPLFSSSPPPTLTQKPKIVAIAPDGSRSEFYEAPANDAYNTGYFSGKGLTSGTYPIDAVFKLAADASGNVFYEDALANGITLLPKPSQ